MRALIFLGLCFFYLHWVLVFILTLLCNLFKIIWRTLTQNTSDKHHLTLFQAAHDHVFTHLYDFVSSEGFGLETFKFETTDNANLEMWRVFKKDAPLVKPYPILLMHGLLDCSSSWFLHVNKHQSLPYILAAEGYEVWVGNNRGNRVSQKEKHPDQHFWDFNLDHLVDFDQPAMIEGVLKHSNKDKLIYVGHSQGSAQFVLGMGVHQHLQNKIAGFIGLGTVVSMHDLGDHLILKNMSKFKLMELCNWIGFKRLLILPQIFTKAFGILVYNYSFYHNFTMAIVRMLCGFSTKNKISKDYFGVMLAHEPGGTSSNNILQWIQCYRNGDMRRFDYGPEKNLEVYGSEESQSYCLKGLENLPFKSYLFRGSKDAVISDDSFSRLVSYFKPEKIETYDLHDYHHLEYLWSETAHQDLYPQIIKIVSQCTKS